MINQFSHQDTRPRLRGNYRGIRCGGARRIPEMPGSFVARAKMRTRSSIPSAPYLYYIHHSNSSHAGTRMHSRARPANEYCSAHSCETHASFPLWASRGYLLLARYQSQQSIRLFSLSSMRGNEVTYLSWPLRRPLEQMLGRVQCKEGKKAGTERSFPPGNSSSGEFLFL